MNLYSKRIILSTIIFGIVLLLGLELFARYYLGLGTPPLSVFHPKIEYLFKPNQDVYRFHNHIIINKFGMRSISFNKKFSNKFRIMVFGDSVLNGGNLTDQSKLATSLLQERLDKEIKNKFLVGNISAGSWGPGNWLAYANEYDFFDAYVVALIISSHDFADNPTFAPLNKHTHPTKRPISALIEGITRYLPRYLPKISSTNPQKPDEFEKPTIGEIEKGLNDLKDFLILAKKKTKFVFVFQHWEMGELIKGEAKQGNQLIKELCESLGISPIQLLPYFERSIENGANPYRDAIHPNQIGQQLIAEALIEHLPNNAFPNISF